MDCNTHRKVRICLDAGHGGWQSGRKVIVPDLSRGSDSVPVHESDLNWHLKNRIYDALDATGGFEILDTRPSLLDGPTPGGRVRMSDAFGADVFLSIHANGWHDDGPNGWEVWYAGDHADDNRSWWLANGIANRFRDFPIAERGLRPREGDRNDVMHRSHKTVLSENPNPVATVLIEAGFMSNKTDLDWMASRDGQSSIAHAVCLAVTDFSRRLVA